MLQIFYMKGGPKMMPYPIIAVIFSLLFFQSQLLHAEEGLQLQNETDRIGYSLGYQIGSDFKHQGLELDEAALLSGFNDANEGVEPALDRQEMELLLGNLKREINATERESMDNRRARKQREAEEKRNKSQKFLAENRLKPGVKTLPSGLQYKVIKSGTGEMPVLHDLVRVHYVARLIDGHEFDSSYRKNAPSNFRVGGVIPGWTEALQLMHEGDKWEIYIPPELAFGSRGPLGNQTLIYEIELVEVVEERKTAVNRTATK